MNLTRYVSPVAPLPHNVQRSCLVASDRGTAQRVVAHFGRHRVGVATVKILEELPQAAGAGTRWAGGWVGGWEPAK